MSRYFKIGASWGGFESLVIPADLKKIRTAVPWTELAYPSLEPIASITATRSLEFPYVPGLFSFREAPAILCALKKLKTSPDVMIFDGQGRAHPRRLGIAGHVGVLLDIPTIGCAESRLCGKHDEPARERGSHVPLIDKGEIIGAVVRTRSGVKPL